MKDLDKNRDGQVDEIEALNAFGAKFGSFELPADGDAKAIAQSRAARLFKAVDNNSDGVISVVEAPGGLGDVFMSIDTSDREADAKGAGRATHKRSAESV